MTLRERYRRHRADRVRQRACLGENGEFGQRRGLRYRRGVDLERVTTVAQEGGHTVVKAERQIIARSEDGWLVKRTSRRRARRLWWNAYGLEVRGIPTPPLWARGPDWVVGEWTDGLPLDQYVHAAYANLGRAGRNTFLRRLAALLRDMHERGVFHHDLKGENLVVVDGAVQAVDLDRVSFTLRVSRRRRVLNLAQINASVTPPVTRTDRLRLLRYYLDGDGSAMDERDWITRIMRTTIARHHAWP
jgi:tRNA A-37 threonylcarbamoyl transferase component Bud32